MEELEHLEQGIFILFGTIFIVSMILAFVIRHCIRRIENLESRLDATEENFGDEY